MGVEDELAEIEGVTTAMLVAFGENGIKTVEDLADCATDDLAGWQERAHGQTKQHPGILQSFNLGKPTVEQLILNARVGRLDRAKRDSEPRRSQRKRRRKPVSTTAWPGQRKGSAMGKAKKKLRGRTHTGMGEHRLSI